MALADEKLTSRRVLLERLRDEIYRELVDVGQPIEGSPTGDVPMLSVGAAQKVVNLAFDQPLPPPVETFAEVVTPASIAVSAVCPNCDLPTVIVVTLRPELTVDDDGRSLKVSAKSKASAHVCGQLGLDSIEADGQQSLGILEGGVLVEAWSVDEGLRDALTPASPYEVCGVQVYAEREGERVDLVCGLQKGHDRAPIGDDEGATEAAGHPVALLVDHLDLGPDLTGWNTPPTADGAPGEGLAGVDPDSDSGEPDEEPEA